MALTRVGLSVTLVNNATCTALTFNDTTGAYNVSTNPLGYGLPGGIATTDVTSVSLVLRYQTMGAYITYTFTVAANVINAATLSVNGGTTTNILTALSSTVFPVTSFNITGSYGVVIPSMEDGVYQAEYTIEGTSGGTPFSYTSSAQLVSTCTVCCCNAKQYAALDPDCECSNTALDKANRVKGWITAAETAAKYGNIDSAVASLNRAAKLCEDCGCPDC